MYGKVFATMFDGSLHGHWQAIVTLQQMIVLADKEGVVDMSPEALSARTSIPLEIIKAGVAELEHPDARSRTPDMEGRRIARLDPGRDWGWVIVNYRRYRAIRTADERRDYMRQYQRDRRASQASTPRKQRSTKSTNGSRQDANGNTNGDIKDLVAQGATSEPSTDLVSTNGNGHRETGKSVEAIIGYLHEVGEQTDRRLSLKALREIHTQIVFAYWAKRLGHEKTLLDDKRKRVLVKRLVENGDIVSELLYAVDGALRDPWTMGTAPNSPRAYDGIEVIFRDRAQVERFAGAVPEWKAGKMHPMAAKYATPAARDGQLVVAD